MTEALDSNVERQHYFSNYDSFGRFASYWHQIDEVTRLGGRILEIGVGNGTVNAVLKRRGLSVESLDIDPALEPDVIGDIRQLPFADASFDTALVAEVLEHLPWSDLETALAEVARVVRRGAVISVPHGGAWLALSGDVPSAIHVLRLALRRRIALRHALWSLTLPVAWRRHGGAVAVVGSLPGLRREARPSCGQHYWELGVAGVEPGHFVTALERTGFDVVRDYRPAPNPYHHFFVVSSGTAT